MTKLKRFLKLLYAVNDFEESQCTKPYITKCLALTITKIVKNIGIVSVNQENKDCKREGLVRQSPKSTTQNEVEFSTRCDVFFDLLQYTHAHGKM